MQHPQDINRSGQMHETHIRLCLVGQFGTVR